MSCVSNNGMGLTNVSTALLSGIHQTSKFRTDGYVMFFCWEEFEILPATLIQCFLKPMFWQPMELNWNLANGLRAYTFIPQKILGNL